MTQMATGALTVERFAKGKSFQEYLESGIRNRELFEQNYEGLKISPEQDKALKALAARPGGPARLAVIGEDWCPDVYRGAPVAARMAEAMGIEFRFFERDQNTDVMANYLNGEFQSIPVLVFFNKDQEELARFVERPKLANEQIHQTREVLGDTSPEGIAKKLGHEPSEDEIKAARAEARERYMEWQRGETWANWRVATVDELISLLS
ncbi:MAG: thioredoxin family protein [Dehalococcoidia bacterium]